MKSLKTDIITKFAVDKIIDQTARCLHFYQRYIFPYAIQISWSTKKPLFLHYYMYDTSKFGRI